MDKQTKVITFNNLLSQFLTFLRITFKDDKISEYETQIKLSEMLNPIYVYECFQEYVLPYRQKIEDCDEDFFITEMKKNDNGDTGFIDFKSLWYKKENTIEVKSKIFLYFRKFIKLLS